MNSVIDFQSEYAVAVTFQHVVFVQDRLTINVMTVAHGECETPKKSNTYQH